MADDKVSSWINDMLDAIDWIERITAGVAFANVPMNFCIYGHTVELHQETPDDFI